MRTIMRLALLPLAGCATVAGSQPNDRAPVRITYETGPCFGTCPVYGIDVAADGTGRFDGRRFTAATGTRSLPVTRAQFDRFVRALARHRPETGERRFSHGTPGCADAPTDMPSVSIRWTEADGDSQALHYYFGCDAENPGKSAGLRAAVVALPVADLIGRR